MARMTCFLEDEEPLTGIAERGHVPVLVPVLVVGGGFPVNPLSFQYIRERLQDEGFFDDARISGLCLLDLEDVDEIEGLHEHGFDVARLLQEWQASELPDVPLNNYLLSIGIRGEVRRPNRMRESVDATFRTSSDDLASIPTSRVEIRRVDRAASRSACSAALSRMLVRLV